jgi:hypothetical protein
MTTPALTAGHRLPPLALRGLSGTGPVSIDCNGRWSAIVLALHAGCSACAAYAQAVEQQEADIAEWDCRLLAVEGASSPGVPVPGVLVADPWCELAAVLDAGAEHAFPEVSELVDWARYLGTTCPECEGEAL